MPLRLPLQRCLQVPSGPHSGVKLSRGCLRRESEWQYRLAKGYFHHRKNNKAPTSCLKPKVDGCVRQTIQKPIEQPLLIHPKVEEQEETGKLHVCTNPTNTEESEEPLTTVKSTCGSGKSIHSKSRRKPKASSKNVNYVEKETMPYYYYVPLFLGLFFMQLPSLFPLLYYPLNFLFISIAAVVLALPTIQKMWIWLQTRKKKILQLKLHTKMKYMKQKRKPVRTIQIWKPRKKRRKKTTRKPQTLTVNIVSTHSSKIIVPAVINGHQVEVFIDSGAQACLITQACLENITTNKDERVNVSDSTSKAILRDHSGQIIPQVCAPKILSITVDQMTTSHTFYIIEGKSQHDVLLGLCGIKSLHLDIIGGNEVRTSKKYIRSLTLKSLEDIHVAPGESQSVKASFEEPPIVFDSNTYKVTPREENNDLPMRVHEQVLTTIAGINTIVIENTSSTEFSMPAGTVLADCSAIHNDHESDTANVISDADLTDKEKTGLMTPLMGKETSYDLRQPS